MFYSTWLRGFMYQDGNLWLAFGHDGPSTWNAFSNTLKCSSDCLPIVFFLMSSKTFLLFVLLAH